MKYSLKTLMLVVLGLSVWFGTAKWFYLQGKSDESQFWIQDLGHHIDWLRAELNKDSGLETRFSLIATDVLALEDARNKDNYWFCRLRDQVDSDRYFLIEQLCEIDKKLNTHFGDGAKERAVDSMDDGNAKEFMRVLKEMEKR